MRSKNRIFRRLGLVSVAFAVAVLLASTFQTELAATASKGKDLGGVVERQKLPIADADKLRLREPHSTIAFFHKKALKDLEKGMGGMQKGTKIPSLPGSSGSPVSSSPSTSATAWKFEGLDGDKMDMLCNKERGWSYTYTPPDLSVLVSDFKVPLEKLPSLLEESSQSPGMRSVPDFQAFEEGFNTEKIKELFQRFLSEKSPETLSQFKKISGSDSSGQKEQDDAIFGYGLILLHYRQYLRNPSLPIQYIKRAALKGQKGGSYVWGAFHFYGEAGVRRDVNIAGNFVKNAQELPEQESEDDVGGSSGGGPIFKAFKPATILLTEIGKDPEFKYRKMYASLEKQAAEMKKEVDRVGKIKSGSDLYKQVIRLNVRTIEARAELASVLGLTSKYNEMTAEIEFIKQEQNPDYAIVEKSFRIKKNVDEMLIKELAKKEQLSADQRVALKTAEKSNRQLVGQASLLTTNFFMTAMAGGAGTVFSAEFLSDAGRVLTGVNDSINTSCEVRDSIKVAAINQPDPMVIKEETIDLGTLDES